MKFKIPFGNIIIALVFIIAFYAGTVMEGEIGGFPTDLSANAAMDFKTEEKNKEIPVISSVLPLNFKLKTAMVKNDDIPNTNYTTDAPVLASGQSEKVQIKNDSGYEIDIEGLLSKKAEISPGQAAVLILHTHTSEAYTKSEDFLYSESEPYRTQDSEKNIVAVGRVLGDTLKKAGIEVIHDETYHDYPSYTGSYKRALETIEKNLSEHPEILLVLDIHRDALQNEKGEYMKTLAEEGCAQAMVVIGTDSGGLEHDNWRDNLAWGLKIQKAVKEKYPAVLRDLHLCAERYNGHTSSGAMIIEIGSNGNTLPEAKKCAALLGECIADVIKGL